MINNDAEYVAMQAVESKHWWYKTLHEKVLLNLPKHKSIKILDAGCGTGGLLSKLQDAGYYNIEGFDYNDKALSFCKEKKFKVQKIDIRELEKYHEAQSFDVIICNDVLYQFEIFEIQNILHQFKNLLKSNGILIGNNQAFNVFKGTHDIAVGSKRRFTILDFKQYLLEIPELQIQLFNYWSLFLSPLILLIRLLQRLKLRLNFEDLKNIKSDVGVVNPFLNTLFYKLLKFESKVISKSPFGSSLFLVITKK